MREFKGFVTYVYRGAQYFEQPSNTHISKIEYDKDENMTIVYLKHNTYFIEALCLIILIVLICLVYTNLDYVYVIHLPQSVYYYNDRLYINAVADVNNSNTVNYSIAGCSGILNPGESLEYVDYTYDNQASETITYTIKILGINRTFFKELPIVAYQVDYGGLEDEGY